MKTRKLLILCLGILLVLFACKKDAVICSKSEMTAFNPESKPVNQKIYNLTTEQTTKIVKEFKQNSQNSNVRLIAADSVLIDSSLFVVEAALNYDFDYRLDSNYTFEIDSADYVIDHAGQKVSSNDLETVYSELGDFISSKINSSHQIKMIDVKASVSGTEVTYKAIVIILAISSPVYPCTVGTSIQSYLSCNAPYGAWCSPASGIDGLAAINQVLNCWDSQTSCANDDHYYSGIMVVTYSGAFACNLNSTFNTTSWHCQNYIFLTPSNLNSYISAIHAQGVNSNPNVFILDPFFKYLTGNYTTNNPNSSYRWSTNIAYGQINCLSVPRE